MINVPLKVGSDSAYFSVKVQAESIQQVVKIVKGRYPGDDVRMVHPIDSGAFFVDDSTVPGLVELEIPESMAE